MEHKVYLALGANLGDRLGNLRAAIAAMPPELRPSTQSKVYETPPWGYIDQPAFLNMAVEATTDLPPLGLLAYLKALESRLGRRLTFRNGPRVIDLDILFYDDLVLKTDKLTIPHPRIAERAFVLAPLADLAPDFHHPANGQTVRQMLEQVDATLVRVYDPPPV